MENPRIYGERPYTVAVLHGGPGAPGEMAPVARELSRARGVLEPLQTAADITGQVDELARLLEDRADLPVTLIGWSWGAWLGVLLAAAYPSMTGKLILVGSPPFEERFAAGILQTRLDRLAEDQRASLGALMRSLENRDLPAGGDSLRTLHDILMTADSCNLLPSGNEVLEFQPSINHSVWAEAARMRRSGQLLQLASRVTCTVVAIHGEEDPHPAEGVREPLTQVLRDFRFISLADCGHYPWFERAAREEFFDLLELELQNLS